MPKEFTYEYLLSIPYNPDKLPIEYELPYTFKFEDYTGMARVKHPTFTSMIPKSAQTDDIIRFKQGPREFGIKIIGFKNVAGGRRRTRRGKRRGRKSHKRRS